MERESFKLFKEYSEAAIVEKRRALSDEILLRATSYIFINAGRYFFFGSQNQKYSRSRGTLRLKKLHFSMRIYVDINLWLTFSMCFR